MAKAKKWTIWIIIIAIIIGGVFWYIKSHQPKTTYTTADVIKGTLNQTVSVTGKINPNHQIDLTFKTTGILKSINVDVGDTVKKGQILAIIDSGSLLSQLRQAEALVKYQKETLDNMKKNPSTYGYDQKDAQRAQIVSAQEGVNAIRDQLVDVRMISPIDGIVIGRTADPGETVVLSLNSPVITIAQKEDLIIQANVPESDIVKVQIGQKADITFDALPAEDIFPANIYEIDPASTIIQDVVYYRIKLKLDSLDPRLKAGMSTNIDVHTAEKENVLMVSQRAIKTEGNKKFVDVLQEDNTTKKVFVETGLEGDEGMVEITSGLKGGEKVVTFVTTK
jgi:RND family efflux transporter MFP subunit